MAMQRMAHTDGEKATARAAAKFGIPMVIILPVERFERLLHILA